MSPQSANVPPSRPQHAGKSPTPENRGLLKQNPNSNYPPPRDKGNVGAIWYSFDLVHKRIQPGGWTHEVTQRELPNSKDLAGVNMRLDAGAYRELHWHTADEWAYMMYGKARLTLMQPDGTMFIEDVNEGDLWLFPAGFPHSIQGLGPDGCEFLLVFNEGDFSEDGTFLLSEWLAHAPKEVLAKNLRLNDKAIAKLPTKDLYIFPGAMPGSLEADRKEVGASADATSQYIFRLSQMPPTKVTNGGEVRVVDSRNFPASINFAAALVRVKPGGMRELHWHSNASEWQFYLQGSARMTILMPVDNARTMDFHAKDVGYVPRVAPHYIENTGDDDLVFLEMFAAPELLDVSLNQWLRNLPKQVVRDHLNLTDEEIDTIPDEKAEVLL
ncbi:MAG: cupin domain-containing protein [Acidobacteriaceae bacterium]